MHGSFEAIKVALDKLGTEQVKVRILSGGVGALSESDISLAAASNAIVIGFNVRAIPQARDLAKRDGVEIRYHSIIYELIDEVQPQWVVCLAQIRKRISSVMQKSVRSSQYRNWARWLVVWLQMVSSSVAVRSFAS